MKRLSELFVIACCVAALAPITWTASSSLKSPSELTLVPPTLVPHNPTLSNYRVLLLERPFLRYCLNSFVIATMTSLLCVAAACLAAYRLARMGGNVRAFSRIGLLAVAFAFAASMRFFMSSADAEARSEIVFALIEAYRSDAAAIAALRFCSK